MLCRLELCPEGYFLVSRGDFLRDEPKSPLYLFLDIRTWGRNGFDRGWTKQIASRDDCRTRESVRQTKANSNTLASMVSRNANMEVMAA